VPLPEPSVARLSADGDTVYALGTDTLFRLAWNGRTLVRDASWSHRYRTRPEQSYGWDVVLEGGHAWFMDQGAHDYAGTMLGAGVAIGPIRLHRVSLVDARDCDAVEISGLARGACTNPPAYDPERRIAIAYDSGNGVIAAWRHTDSGALALLWRRPLATAGHLIRFPDTGVLLAYDFRAPAVFRTRAFRAIARRIAPLTAHRDARRVLAHATTEDVVLLDIATGEERARATVPTIFQSVVFPAPGWSNDVYSCSFLDDRARRVLTARPWLDAPVTPRNTDPKSWPAARHLPIPLRGRRASPRGCAYTCARRRKSRRRARSCGASGSERSARRRRARTCTSAGRSGTRP
jgi:hypothetical protein